MRAMRSLVRALLALALVTMAACLTSPAQASDGKQRVYGGINCPKLSKCPNMKVLWFDKSWGYLGTARANGGGYALRLAPGRYHLQFVDQRPSYDTSKYAPTDIAVTVGRHPVGTSVTMKRGAAITGVARAGGQALGGARVVAANRSEQSFATTANKKGQFAVGGLPAGKYCLFTYDKAKRYVGKCTWAGGVNFGQIKNKTVKLTTKAGNLTVFLDTKDGGNAPRSTVTVTSRATGQWWTAAARSGKAVFRGLYPGRYNVKYDGGGIWLAATGVVRNGTVRSSRMAFGDFTLTKRGATVTGTVVDKEDPQYPLEGAQVLLYNQSGDLLGSTTSDSDGRFRFVGQLEIQQNLTVVGQPGPYSEYLGQGTHYCKYERTESEPFSITTGQVTNIGDLELAHRPANEQDGEQCYPSQG